MRIDGCFVTPSRQKVSCDGHSKTPAFASAEHGNWFNLTARSLTRSFWFLFPVATFNVLSLQAAQVEEPSLSSRCSGCDRTFKPVGPPSMLRGKLTRSYQKSVSIKASRCK